MDTMTEQSQEKDISSASPDNSEVVALIKKLQQQMAYLEKKIDILVEGSSRKPFGEKRFSKPFRSGGGRHSGRGGWTEGRNHSRDRNSGGGSRSFDRSRGGQGFGGQSRDRQSYSGGQSRDRQSYSGGQSRGGQGYGGQSRGGQSRGGQSRGGQGYGGQSHGFNPRKKRSFSQKKDRD